MDNPNAHTLDPLLGCLGIVCKINEMPFSEESAIAGLPLEAGLLTPTIFVRAAKRVGLSAHINKRKLKKLSHLVLPAILILENDNACVVKAIDGDSVELVFPENPEESRSIAMDDLNADYTGYVIYATPTHEEEQTQSAVGPEVGKSWFWGVILRYKSIFVHVLIAAFLSNLFVLVIPIYIMNIYDRVIPTNSISTLWMLTIGALIFFLFDFLARVLRGYLIDLAGRRADIILGQEMFAQLMNLRMRQKPPSAGGMTNYFNEFDALREFFTSATMVMIIDVPFALLFLAAIYFIGGSLALIPGTAVVFVVLIASLFEMPTMRAIKKAIAGNILKNSILVESLTGLETIKCIGAEGIMQRRWENSLANTTKANLSSRALANVSVNLAVWVQQLVIISVVAYGVFLINANLLTVGGLIACTILSGRVMMLSQIVNLSTRFARSRQSLKSFNEFMGQKHERSPDHKYLHRPVIKGDIEFENVSFLYPNRRVNAVENISMRIAAGDKVGIIGRMGSGKSTLMRLLVSLYVPNTGAIKVDGTDNTEIDPADLRNNIRYVSSENTLFNGSVKENIMMGAARDADDEAFVKACKISGVDDFISQSPLGYDLRVGERGESLSSGQRQAIIIARALMANPSVLLLDEPTTGVDLSYERELMNNIEDYVKDKTLLIATHRIPLLKLVDRVIVMDGGKIIADGPRDDILKAMKVTLPNDKKED